jgi:hypothetical protein
MNRKKFNQILPIDNEECGEGGEWVKVILNFRLNWANE